MDRDLIKFLDLNIEPLLLLEDIETGSIKTWLRNRIEQIDDEALKKMEWKQIVGSYLVRAKYLIVNFLKDKTEISNRGQIEDLERNLLMLAKETDIKAIPTYAPIPLPRLIHNIERITNSLSHLKESDQANYITSEGKIPFNLSFNMSPESIEELITKEIIMTKAKMILRVKKPDYLGDSMWEFKHGNNSIPAKILHIEWLKSFQNRQVDVRPGDSIKGWVDVEVRYGFDGEVINTHYYITEVIDIIPFNPADQLPLAFDK